MRARNFVRDAIARSGRKTPPNPDLVFLAIDSDSVGLDEDLDIKQMFGLRDDDSIEARALRVMIKQFPWPREIYGLILERLVEAGGKGGLFEPDLSTPTPGGEVFFPSLRKKIR